MLRALYRNARLLLAWPLLTGLGACADHDEIHDSSHPADHDPCSSVDARCAGRMARRPSEPNLGALGNLGAARHVIFFIGDGMGRGCEVAASRYWTGRDTGLVINELSYQGAVTTWDTTTYGRYAKARERGAYDPDDFDATLGYDPTRGGSWPTDPTDTTVLDYFATPLQLFAGGGAAVPATDSASSATAMSTGFKTESGNVAWSDGDPPDGELTTILEMARQQLAARVGVVSTVPFSHATPASFASHTTTRHAYILPSGELSAIDQQIALGTEPDVVISGGHPNFGSGFVSKATLEALQSSSEYGCVERKVGVAATPVLEEAAERVAATDGKLFGLYGMVDGSFGRWQLSDDDGGGKPTRERPSPENPTLAEATTAALTALRGSDSAPTFLMVEQGDIDWANHARDATWMLGAMLDLDAAVRAAIDFVEEPGDDWDWDNTLLIVTADHENGYVRVDGDLKRGDLPPLSTGTEIEGRILYSVVGHTNEPVMLHAQGAGADDFERLEGAWYPGTRLLDDTQIFQVMCGALGLVGCGGRPTPKR